MSANNFITRWDIKGIWQAQEQYNILCPPCWIIPWSSTVAPDKFCWPLCVTPSCSDLSSSIVLKSLYQQKNMSTVTAKYMKDRMLSYETGLLVMRIIEKWYGHCSNLIVSHYQLQ